MALRVRGYADGVIIRKAFFGWLFPAAVLLPVWLLIGWAAFREGSGWSFFGLLLLCPLLCFAQLAIGGILVARRSVRDSRAVSWQDAGLLTGWHICIVAFGFFPPGATPWFAVLGVLFFIGLFWVGLAELAIETRARVAQAFAPSHTAGQPPPAHWPAVPFAKDTELAGPEVVGAEVIVIEERREE